MDRDRKVICDIISNMLDSPDKSGIYPTTEAYDKLEAYVESIRAESIGWTVADACCSLDRGDDYREKEVPSILQRALKDLAVQPIEEK